MFVPAVIVRSGSLILKKKWNNDITSIVLQFSSLWSFVKIHVPAGHCFSLLIKCVCVFFFFFKL